MNRLFSAFVVSLFSTTLLLGALYRVDFFHTNVTFEVDHMMVSTVEGKFDRFKGFYKLDEQNRLTLLHGSVETNTIHTDDESRDLHLQSEDFFDVEKYPRITFELDKIVDDKVYGKLTIKDVTKELVLDYKFIGYTTDIWDQKRSKISLEGVIDRNDFGLTWNAVIEAGGVLVGDEVKIKVEIEGILYE